VIASKPVVRKPHRRSKFSASASRFDAEQFIGHFGTTNQVDGRLVMRVMWCVWRFFIEPLGFPSLVGIFISFSSNVISFRRPACYVNGTLSPLLLSGACRCLSGRLSIGVPPRESFFAGLLPPSRAVANVTPMKGSIPRSR
jgi:hypothetical protein